MRDSFQLVGSHVVYRKLFCNVGKHLLFMFRNILTIKEVEFPSILLYIYILYISIRFILFLLQKYSLCENENNVGFKENMLQ